MRPVSQDERTPDGECGNNPMPPISVKPRLTRIFQLALGMWIDCVVLANISTPIERMSILGLTVVVPFWQKTTVCLDLPSSWQKTTVCPSRKAPKLIQTVETCHFLAETDGLGAPNRRFLPRKSSIETNRQFLPKQRAKPTNPTLARSSGHDSPASMENRLKSKGFSQIQSSSSTTDS